MVNLITRDDKHVVRKIKQPRAENCLVLLLQVLYFNLEFKDCQGPLRIKINAQILIRSKQRKSSSRSFPSCRRKAIGSRMMGMVAFSFSGAETIMPGLKNWYAVKKRDHGSYHRRWNRHTSTYVCKVKQGFVDFEKIKRSLKKLSQNACNLSKKVIQW